MPLFKCQKCGAVENTATGQYWGYDEKQCSECATGKWHGQFDKKNATESGYFKDSAGFLYGPDEVDQKTMRWKYNQQYKMVGKA